MKARQIPLLPCLQESNKSDKVSKSIILCINNKHINIWFNQETKMLKKEFYKKSERVLVNDLWNELVDFLIDFDYKNKEISIHSSAMDKNNSKTLTIRDPFDKDKNLAKGLDENCKFFFLIKK